MTQYTKKLISHTMYNKDLIDLYVVETEKGFEYQLWIGNRNVYTERCKNKVLVENAKRDLSNK